MRVTAHDFDPLAREHLAPMHEHGSVRSHCRAWPCAEAREIDRLTAQNMRLRAAVILRETELAWAKENRAALEQAIQAAQANRIGASRRCAECAHPGLNA